jgi:hypothetical protein
MGLSFRRRQRALSDRPTGSANQAGPGCLILFGLLFGGFGSIFAVIFFFLPMMRAFAAETWIEVPCTILESRVGESSDSDGTTYRVEVRYEYRFRAGDLENDPTAPRYESQRYDFCDGMYSSGAAEKRAEVERLAPGTRTTCRVDPQEPGQAVLKAGLPDDLWIGLFTLIFPLVGLAMVVGGVVSAVRGRRTRAALASSIANGQSNSAAMPTPPDEPDGAVELRPAQGRVGKLVGIGIFAAIWNGIVWTIILVALLPEIRKGGMAEWFPLLFLSLFALIGLVLIGAVLHQLLALTNPRLRLTVNRRAFRPGETLELEWECSGNPARVTVLTITLEGRESATYTRGTDTTTETHLFARLPLAKLEDAVAILGGRAKLVLPSDTVATFIASRNKIEWSLCVRGVIPRWPDISDDYGITILPPRSGP